MPNLKIMLVDDHPVVRAGLRAVLTEQGGLEVLAEAADGAAALAQLERLKTLGRRVDVVLMDLQMDGMDGVTATAKIRVQGGPPVLILTTYDSDADIRAALDAGAAGYLLKDAPLPDVLAAVEAAAAGEQVLSADLAARITPRPGPTPPTSARANSSCCSCWPAGRATRRSPANCSFPSPRSRHT